MDLSNVLTSAQYQSRDELPPLLTIGKYLLDRLYQLGVGHIFGIPGDYIIRFDKLIEQHPIRFVNATRENTAGFMADAYARLNGLGVVCITYGVGINIANAISQAYVESSPVVLISGAAGTDELLHGEKLHHMIFKASKARLQENTQLEMLKHITVDQVIIDDPKEASFKIDRALHTCMQLKKPIYIELPRNLIDMPVETFHSYSFEVPTYDPSVLQEALKEVEATLRRSHHPVLWLGHEIQRFELQQPILEFAEKYQIPIVSSLLGKSVIAETHPLYAGVYSGKLSRSEIVEFVEKMRLRLILGLIMSDVDTGIFTASLNHAAKIVAHAGLIQINHHVYPDILFQDFISGFSFLDLPKPFTSTIPRYAKALSVPFIPNLHKKITTEKIFECLQSHLTAEHIIITDIGDCLFGAMDLIVEQNAFLSCAYFATLGFGVPGALGAQFANLNKRVIGIVGDGAFQMTGTELSTAVRYRLDPIILVLNNHGYGTERPLIEGRYNDILDWNYTEMTRLLGGGIGIKVTTEQELERAFQTAFGKRGTFFLIEIDLEKTDFSPALRRLTALIKK